MLLVDAFLRECLKSRNNDTTRCNHIVFSSSATFSETNHLGDMNSKT